MLLLVVSIRNSKRWEHTLNVLTVLFKIKFEVVRNNFDFNQTQIHLETTALSLYVSSG